MSILRSDWCGSVGWASSYKPKGGQHMPVLRAKYLPGGVQEAANQYFSSTWMFLSLSFLSK